MASTSQLRGRRSGGTTTCGRIRWVTSLALLPLLSGCIAEFLVMDEAEVAGVRAAALEGVDASLVDEAAAGMGITAEDVALFRSSTSAIEAGRLVSADEVAFNAGLEKIEIVRQWSGRLDLFVRGADRPFGQVLTDQRAIRLFNGNRFTLTEDLMYAREPGVRVLRSPATDNGNVVTTLKDGEVAVALSEKNGWYRVRIVRDGQELVGYAREGLLVPLFTAFACAEDSARSIVETLHAEDERRGQLRDESGHLGIPDVTVAQAMEIIYHDFGYIGASRRTAHSVEDWPADVREFVRMRAAHVPILTEPTLQDPSVRGIGFTVAGEVLKFVALRQTGVTLHNPLASGPWAEGDWYEVETLDGARGWIFALPYGQQGSSVKRTGRCDPAGLRVRNQSHDAYVVRIDGYQAFRLPGGGSTTVADVPIGERKLHVTQLDGYHFFATSETFSFTPQCGKTVEVVFP